MAKFTRKIVAIGGGDIRSKGTLAIDKEIIALSGKKKPCLLFIPTASSDHEGYWKHIEKYYGKLLGCKTDVLYLIRKQLTKAEIKKKIQTADIIYVGGGNTLKMMRLWRRIGVDTLLKRAWKRGTVLCGISAGSICWFDSGHSDSLSFYNPDDWRYINVRGLGFVKGVHCPHYNSETLGIARKKNFQDMMQRKRGTGIAIDNNCAIAFVDNKYRVISSKKGYGAYRLYKRSGKLISKRIKEEKLLRPAKKLYEKI